MPRLRRNSRPRPLWFGTTLQTLRLEEPLMTSFLVVCLLSKELTTPLKASRSSTLTRRTSFIVTQKTQTLKTLAMLGLSEESPLLSSSGWLVKTLRRSSTKRLQRSQPAETETTQRTSIVSTTTIKRVELFTVMTTTLLKSLTLSSCLQTRCTSRREKTSTET